ncbi:MAG TPA: hypothetical protein VII73_10160, partial [Caulobacteraceae bacterium]
GWAVMATAPFLGASIDKLGRRKIWLALVVAAMVPLIGALWFTKADHSGLSVTQTLAIAAIVGVLFSYSEVLHNSLLVRAAGLSAAHKASGLALALGNGFALAALGFTAWAFALPGLPQTANWLWIPKAPLFGLDRALHQPERVVALMAAGIFALGPCRCFCSRPMRRRRVRRCSRLCAAARPIFGAWCGPSGAIATPPSSWPRGCSTSMA